MDHTPPTASNFLVSANNVPLVASGPVGAGGGYRVSARRLLQRVDLPQSTASLSRQFAEIIPSFISTHVQDFIDTRLLSANAADIEKEARATGADIQTVAAHHDWKIPEFRPQAITSFAAVVMADVSGYSKLTSLLAERGNTGTEILSRTMKRYLDSIVYIIMRHKGDIVKFAGDAVVAYWKCDCEPKEMQRRQKLTCVWEVSPWEPCECLKCTHGEVVLRASMCCVELLQKLGRFAVNIENCPIKELSIHLGVGAGQMFDVHVFGDDDRWEHFLAGPAVNQLELVLDRAKPAQLGVSITAWDLLNRVATATTLQVLRIDKECAILEASQLTGRRVAWPVTPKSPVAGNIPFNVRISLYKKYINHAVINKLVSGYDNLMALNELRQLTTVFIHIGDLKFTSVDELEKTQQAVEIVQRAVTKYEGSLRQFHVDDKGATILAFFGLPPLAHEDDAGYGIKTAMEVAKEFRIFDSFSIGVTTGTVAIGGIGYQSRTEYALFGDSINMAARLMLLETAKNSIVCDDRTYILCHRNIRFDQPEQATVKGKSKPIAIYKVTGNNKERMRRAGSEQKVGPVPNDCEDDKKGQVIGRSAEKAKFQEALHTYLGGDPAILVVEGDAGAGLSTFYAYLKHQASLLDIVVCTGIASDINKTTPLYIFQDIVYDLIAIASKLQVVDDDQSRESPASRPDVPSISISNLTDSDTGTTKSKTRMVVSQNVLADVLEVEAETETPSRSGAAARSLSLAADSETIKPAPVTDSRTSSSPNDISAGGQYLDVGARSQILTADYQPISSISIPPESIQFSPDISREMLPSGGTGAPNELSPKTSSHQSSLEGQIRNMLSKLGENPNLAHLMSPIFPADFIDDHASRMFQERSVLRELFDLLRRLFNVISEDIPMLLVVEEAQWGDHVSWSLLDEIASACPNVMICIFSRFQRQYENAAGLEILKRLKVLPHTINLEIAGFKLVDMADLLLFYWQEMIKIGGDSTMTATSVDPKIVEKVHMISDGNPLFARSLLFSLLESGAVHVDQNGQITIIQNTDGKQFDFGDILPGLDLQSVVISQFDKLDTRFQQLLKVACVIGEQFLIEDAIYFVSKNMQTVFWENNLRMLDKYGFLKCETMDNSVNMYSFKSSMIQKTIYSMMHEEQRKKLHLDLAVHFERLLDAKNRMRLLILIYEHYREAGEVDKTRLYLEAVSHFYFETHAFDQAIKHYHLLIDGNPTPDRFLSNSSKMSLSPVSKLAIWYRELGEAYYMADRNYKSAQLYLIKSAKELGYQFPKTRLGQRYERFIQMRTQRRLCLSADPPESVQIESVEGLLELRATLTSLGYVMSRGDTINKYEYEIAMLAALNTSHCLPRDGGHAVLMAIVATFWWQYANDSYELFDYIETAEELIHQQPAVDINQCSTIASCIGTVFFASGYLEQALRKYRSIVSYSEIVEDTTHLYSAALNQYWLEWLLCHDTIPLKIIEQKFRHDMEDNSRCRMKAVILHLAYHLHTYTINSISQMTSLMDSATVRFENPEASAADMTDVINLESMAVAVEIELLLSASNAGVSVTNRYDRLIGRFNKLSNLIRKLKTRPLAILFGMTVLLGPLLQLHGVITRDLEQFTGLRRPMRHINATLSYLAVSQKCLRRMNKAAVAVMVKHIHDVFLSMYNTLRCGVCQSLSTPVSDLLAKAMDLPEADKFPRFAQTMTLIQHQIDKTSQLVPASKTSAAHVSIIKSTVRVRTVVDNAV